MYKRLRSEDMENRGSWYAIKRIEDAKVVALVSKMGVAKTTRDALTADSKVKTHTIHAAYLGAGGLEISDGEMV